ncbi:MAG: NUDIX domain-containing protein [Myxococcaceae bacterium]
MFARLFEVEGAPGDRAREAKLWELAERLVAGKRPGDLNQALMELGATVCKTDWPTCLLCPVRKNCIALAKGRIAELPPPRVRAPRKSLRYATFVWRKGEALLFARREEKGLFGGLWELPSVPAENFEAQTRGRKVKELGTVKRTLTHRDLELRVVALEGRAPTKPPEGYVELTWATPAQAKTFGMSTAMQHAIQAAIR